MAKHSLKQYLNVKCAKSDKMLFKLSNFKGNSDIERFQMANKKIPFKYTRPVEDWLHEKGNLHMTLILVHFFSFHFFPFLFHRFYADNWPDKL